MYVRTKKINNKKFDKARIKKNKKMNGLENNKWNDLPRPSHVSNIHSIEFRNGDINNNNNDNYTHNNKTHNNNTHNNNNDDSTDPRTILTVEVGSTTPSPMITLQRNGVLTANHQMVEPHALDGMLKQYEKEIAAAQRTTPLSENNGNNNGNNNNHHHSWREVKTTTGDSVVNHSRNNHNISLTMTEANKCTNQMIFKLNQVFDLFLQFIQEQAKQSAMCGGGGGGGGSGGGGSGGGGGGGSNNIKQLILEQLNSCGTVHDWQRMEQQLISETQVLDDQQKQLHEQIQSTLKTISEPTTVSYLAGALDENLSIKQELYLADFQSLDTLQQQKTALLSKVASSYVTFYSWILEQWDTNIVKMGETYQKIQQNIKQLFETDPTYRDIEQLLDRYENWLKASARYLPTEFTLTDQSRKEWRERATHNHPEETIRFMNTELKALELIPELKEDVVRWKMQLKPYDSERMRRVFNNRTKIQKKIEFSVEYETSKACQTRWEELNNQIYRLGINIQNKSSQMFSHMQKSYKNRQDAIIDKIKKIDDQNNIYSKRLALSQGDHNNDDEYHFSEDYEQRKHILKQWAIKKYWLLEIQSLLMTFEVLQEFGKQLR